jgi:hypothetical protein
MRILMMAMAMAVASGNAFIASPKTQLAARRTLPHARAMPIVAAYSKIEDEAKDTEVCPHACVMSHLAYGPREPVDLLPLARARPLSPSPHDTTVHAFRLHPAPSTLPTASGSVFPPLPPQAEQTMNWLVAFDKIWLTPGLPLIILYSCIEIDQGDPGFCFYSMFPLI